jgi:orotidine-5'-phosphate decarboxylase
LLLLAEMSSAGSLATGSYTIEAMRMALRHTDFVFGFIGQHRINEIPKENGASANDLVEMEPITHDFIYMTPGVALEAKEDKLGQQYRTPEQVIINDQCDIIIVGRGIYGSGDIVQNAIKYRNAGWNAYLNRTRME